MNKIFDENKINTFRDLKELATSNKLIGRRNIIIAIDERAIEELRNYVYKANMYDDLKKQKDDVVEYIKYQLSNLDLEDIKAKILGSMILVRLEDNRMLGEIDETDNLQ